MSKSVDETVFDFFSVLLQEPTKEVQTSAEDKPTPTASNSNSVSLKKQHSKTFKKPNINNSLGAVVKKVAPPPHQQEVKKAFAEPQVDKASLSKLLSAVSKPEVKQPESKPIHIGEVDSVASDKSAQQVQDEIKLKAQQVRLQLEKAVVQESTVDDVKIISSQNNKEPEISADTSLDKAEVNVSEVELNVEEQHKSSVPPSITGNLQDVLDDEFQVLFFNVAGLTLAVPLVSLGGIVKIEHINHLIGRPNWFLGVQTRREQKVNVVDSCRWVMPEKYTQELADSIDYQYLVMLEDSNWGLACESLVNAVRIDKSHVNWREKPGKRPWLAGVVKEQMCGILNVQALIEMLDAGLGCQDSID
ncbi:chemotaxis protein CheW [Shewanella electrodiphila]|uniref:Chemotaxis protein CheW n=1 Tax=Shewanella electrodiphila TaxID=934143 RepID=A0ABT0KLX9_9GAMM|nr:chemotaxis protein CheW [Shewanella electrodiphila]MCL1044848.1 chemotaxis protein CheW [Shewanella electrodiphila]